MKIKRLLCLALVPMIALMVSCSGDSGTGHQSSFADSDSHPVQEVVINSNFLPGITEFEFEAISQATGIKISTTNYLIDEFFIKILAGDSDVDIYFVRPTEIRLLCEQGIYYPFESEIISDFNDRCFDYLKDCCDVEGQTVYMPISNSVTAVLMPKVAIEETGMEYSDIEYLDGYLEFARNYSGSRTAFTNGSTLFSLLENQYEHFVCDFENNEFDYITPEYLNLYESLLGGYLRYAQEPGAPAGFTHSLAQNGACHSDNVLMTIGSYDSYQDYNDSSYGNGTYNAYGKSVFFEKWRAFPLPKISDKVSGNPTSNLFAMINPYSENKEAAVKVLEEIASNYYVYGDYYTSYSFLFEDKSDYPEKYHPESEIFSDFYDIVKNGYINKYVIFTSHPDIEEYQNGRATLEEAVAMYQREVEMWLNE